MNTEPELLQDASLSFDYIILQPHIPLIQHQGRQQSAKRLAHMYFDVRIRSGLTGFEMSRASRTYCFSRICFMRWNTLIVSRIRRGASSILAARLMHAIATVSAL